MSAAGLPAFCGVQPAVLAVRTRCATLMADDVLDFLRRNGLQFYTIPLAAKRSMISLSILINSSRYTGFNKELPCI
jgi:hypothetical protein